MSPSLTNQLKSIVSILRSWIGRWAYLLALLALAVGVLVGDALPMRCVVKSLTGHPCPGCGMMRATGALLRGEWIEAWHFNPLVYLLSFFSLYFLAREIYYWRKGCKPPLLRLPWWVIGILIILVVGRWFV